MFKGLFLVPAYEIASGFRRFFTTILTLFEWKGLKTRSMSIEMAAPLILEIGSVLVRVGAA